MQVREIIAGVLVVSSIADSRNQMAITADPAEARMLCMIVSGILGRGRHTFSIACSVQLYRCSLDTDSMCRVTRTVCRQQSIMSEMGQG